MKRELRKHILIILLLAALAMPFNENVFDGCRSYTKNFLNSRVFIVCRIDPESSLHVLEDYPNQTLLCYDSITAGTSVFKIDTQVQNRDSESSPGFVFKLI